MATKKQLTERWHTELGKEIGQKLFSMKIFETGHHWKAQDIFQLLEGLPFREEIANGRDFRGTSFAGRQLDLRITDFTYSQPGYFYSCILDHCIFDRCSAQRTTFHDSVVSCSFVSAHLRSCYFNDSNVPNCDFTKAKLNGTSFQDADLRGSRFTGADCRMCTFAGANLMGCDFRGADLRRTVFCDNMLDKTTDFRGADLTSVFTDEWRDNAGNLRRKATDLSLGMLE